MAWITLAWLPAVKSRTNDDTDLDVDCDDWAEFLLGWSGPAAPPDLAQCAAPGSPGRIVAPISVTRSTTPGRLVIAWTPSCSSGAADYGIYEGLLGNWYDHRALDCSDDGADLTEEIAPADGDRYYLVVPFHSTAEGSYGTNGSVAERSAGNGTCVNTQAIDACP